MSTTQQVEVTSDGLASETALLWHRSWNVVPTSVISVIICKPRRTYCSCSYLPHHLFCLLLMYCWAICAALEEASTPQTLWYPSYSITWKDQTGAKRAFDSWQNSDGVGFDPGLVLFFCFWKFRTQNVPILIHVFFKDQFWRRNCL